MSDSISRRAAIEAAVNAADEWDGGMNPKRARIIGKALLNLPSAQPEQRLNCKNCIHLGHGYMMPCKNCKRNQMLPDWYEVETERQEE